MQRAIRLAAILATLGFTVVSHGRAQGAPPDPPAVVAIRSVTQEGGRVSWSAQGDLLAYDRRDREGRYDVFVHDLESGGERCVTCTVYELRGAHVMNPSWSPSGDFLVLQAQQHAKRLKLGLVELQTADRGLHGDLWLVRADGKDLWQLTRNAEQGSAVLDPHFSHEGDQLAWSERVRSRTGTWGLWQLRTAQIRQRRGVPALSRVRAHRPDALRGLVIAEGFLPDDRRLLVSGERDLSGVLDIGIVDPADDSFERLSSSFAGNDEHPRVAPSGDRIAWVADAVGRLPGPATDGGELPAREIWTMALDGSDRRQLTRFNDPRAVEHLGRVWVGDFDWSPRGDQLAVQVIYGVAEPHEEVVILELDPGFAR